MTQPKKSVPKKAIPAIAIGKVVVASKPPEIVSKEPVPETKPSRVQKAKSTPKTTVDVIKPIQAVPTPVELPPPSIEPIRKQVSLQEFNAMTMTAQNELWSALQKQAPEWGFVPCLEKGQLKGREVVRLKDAQADGTAGKGFREQLWCPYCGTWRVFRNHYGYDCCIACSISTNDFYTRCDNHLWGGTDSKNKKTVQAMSRKRQKEDEEGEDE